MPSIAPLRADLLAWYARSHRDLPWRRPSDLRDAYRIWVSEIMLQQTRVETVIPYYERFLARFPAVRALADAPLDEVLAHWSGLGYYRRARMLHAAASTIVRDHAGRFPRTVDAAEALPGIGRSTAGAIVSISYGTRAPVLDGNVERVLTRLFARRGDPKSRELAVELWSLAQQLVDCDSAGDVNQALMELGATVCLPFAAARCSDCPLERHCMARAEGVVETLPKKTRKAELKAAKWAVALVRRGDRFLLRRRGGDRLMAGLWEFPTIEVEPDADAGRELARLLRDRFEIAATFGAPLFVHRQVISNRKVEQPVFAAKLATRGGDAEIAAKAAAEKLETRWLEPAAITALAITMATRKILARVVESDAATAVSPPAAAARPARRPARAP